MDQINHPGKQNGASMWALIGISSLIVLFALITMKMVPAYIDNAKVMSALETLAETPGAGQMSRRQMIDKLAAKLYIDMADDLLDLNTALEITKLKNTKQLSLNYERVIPMAYNISVLLDFENSVEVSLN